MSLQAISYGDTLDAMGKHSKKRHAASEAVIALRKLLGLTQQELAVKLRSAIVTVARWETTHPPHGPTLLHLAEVARHSSLGKHGPTLGMRLGELEGLFMTLYLDEVFASVGGQIWMDPHTQKGFMLVKLDGYEQMAAASQFLNPLPAAKT